jgi:anaerobic magnesium-protoporphyrin IX monomethyl ester cyclase
MHAEASRTNKYRVLLIGPEQEENLSLRYLAAALQAAGFSWQIAPFDTSADTRSVLARVARFHPLVVGLSIAFQSRACEMLDLAKQIRQQCPSCHVTAGGHFASLRAKELLTDFPVLDSVVRSEGEEPLCRLIAAVAQGESLAEVSNLVFRDTDGRIVENHLRDRFPDLDALPWPVRPRHPEKHAGVKTAHILGSRGCYHSSCRYCCIAAFHAMKRGPRYAMRSAHSIAQEMLALRRCGIRVFFFHDDNFFMRDEQQNMERLAALKVEMQALGIEDVRIYIKSRPSTITPGIVSALKQLGVGGLFVGVENHVDAASDYMGRNEHRVHRERALSLLMAADLVSNYNLMLFNPRSTPADVLCNLDFVAENLEIPFNFCRLEVYAGTPVEAEMAMAGKLVGSYLSWDYVIDDPHVERMARWCRRLFARRRFEYQGIVNQNITLGYHADIISHFFPGPTADKLKRKVRSLCRVVNADTLQHLRELLELAVTDSDTVQRQEESLAAIERRIETADRRFSREFIITRRDLDVYALACSWVARFHLGDSHNMAGPIFERLFAIDQ